jgi:hypothetical protein
MKDAPAAEPETLISEARLLRLLDITRRQGENLRLNGSLRASAVCERTRLYRSEQVKALAVQIGRAVPSI